MTTVDEVTARFKKYLTDKYESGLDEDEKFKVSVDDYIRDYHLSFDEAIDRIIFVFKSDSGILPPIPTEN